jgi:hypothetical protein
MLVWGWDCDSGSCDVVLLGWRKERRELTRGQAAKKKAVYRVVRVPHVGHTSNSVSQIEQV